MNLVMVGTAHERGDSTTTMEEGVSIDLMVVGTSEATSGLLSFLK